jgi:hypothetical protein
VRQPIYTSSIGRREGYMPYLEPLLDALNDRSPGMSDR